MKKIIVVLMMSVLIVLNGCSMDEMGDPYYDNVSDPGQNPTDVSGESYSEIKEAPFINVSDLPVSTFSADVDTASYSNVRRYLNDDMLPNENSIRIEELVNYFDYDLDKPLNDEVFGITTEIQAAPWNENHDLMMIGLATEEIEFDNTAGSNLVFLFDVSGSMNSDDKLPLLKTAMKLLVNQLRPQDRVTIVVYAGDSGIVLDGADGADKDAIIDALDSLSAGGSTNGEAGIHLAYSKALEYFIEGGNNRVILCTDGDFNVGAGNTTSLGELIEEKRESGVYFSVLGFGTGNLKDDIMETLADQGNGVYYYIDSILEAKKVFVNELGGSLVTVAKDVKLQVEFNPMYVKAYRLIGYENRTLNYDDFNNNEVDAGDIGAGHEVIAFYEIIPVTSDETVESQTFDPIETLKYNGENFETEISTLKINYKDPTTDMDLSTSHVMLNLETETSETFMFASAVVEYGLLLRSSDYKYDATWDNVISRATLGLGDDEFGYRAEFILLAQQAQSLQEAD